MRIISHEAIDCTSGRSPTRFRVYPRVFACFHKLSLGKADRRFWVERTCLRFQGLRTVPAKGVDLLPEPTPGRGGSSRGHGSGLPMHGHRVPFHQREGHIHVRGLFHRTLENVDQQRHRVHAQLSRVHVDGGQRG